MGCFRSRVADSAVDERLIWGDIRQNDRGPIPSGKLRLDRGLIDPWRFIAGRMVLDFLFNFWNTLCELAPWLLLGMLLSGILHVALPRDFLQRHLRGRWGVLRAVVFGIPLPLCSCGVLPTGIGLHKDGASRGAAVGFLISTPQTGVDSILVCAALLGWPFAIFKVLVALVLGCVGGWLTDAIEPEGPIESVHDRQLTGRPPLSELFPHAMELLRSIWLWMLVGLLVAAVLGTWAPAEAVSRGFGTGVGGIMLANLATLLVSVPLYVCTTSSVPIAAALVSGGFPLATAMVFLIAGPATNVGALLTIAKNLGMRTTAVYLGTIVVGSAISAAVFAWLAMDSPVEAGHLHQHTPHLWQQLAAGVLLALIGWCAIDRWRWKRAVAKVDPDEGFKTYEVEGMTCQNCADRLGKALGNMDGVESAAIDLENHTAHVSGAATATQVEDVIRHCGFHLVGSAGQTVQHAGGCAHKGH